MIYPNGSIELNKLKRMINSKDFIVYYEENTKEPCDWDWKKDGIFHGSKYPIHNEDELISCASRELKGEGTICYDITDEYYKKHPYEGESCTYIKESFFWEYSSHNGKKLCYKICECSYWGKSPKNVPLELVCFEDGFENTCFQIASWERDDEGYEFKSCGSRLFEYVDEEDLREVWKAIKKADEWLNQRFLNEDDE